MNASRLWITAALISIFLLPFGVQAQEQREKTPNGLRQEVLELKRLISEFTARLQKMERRLSKLEKRVELRADPAAKPGADPTKKMRPLGSHLMVDEKGIIWSHGRPVGYWGVDGDMPRGPKSSVPKGLPATPPRGAPR
jgi:hypothetical protein